MIRISLLTKTFQLNWINFFRAFILILCLYISPVFSSEQDVKNLLSPLGITYDFSGNNLEIILDQKKIINSVPILQTKGLLAKTIPQKDLIDKQIPIVVAADIAITSVIMQTLYHNTNVDKLHVSSYIYSSDQLNLCYSFDFDRVTYNKINWKTFDRKYLLDAGKNAKLSSWCEQRLK